jgi:glucokinase
VRNDRTSAVYNDRMACIGIEIGGSKLQSAIVAADGAVLLKETARAPAAAGAAAIRDVLAEQLRRLLDAWGGRAPLEAAGIGFGGPVNRRLGTVAASFHVAGWAEFPLVAWAMEQLGGLPTVIENDTNAAALAEATLGAGRGRRIVVYSNSGSGIGGGLVIDGRLYHGGSVTEMEIGHLRLSPQGGITEDVASGWSIDRRVRAHVATDADGTLARLTAAGHPGARALLAASAAGDTAAAMILDEAARHYAVALSHAVQLLAPEVIVLGGGVAEMGEAWRGRVARHLPRLLMPPLQPGPDVLLAALGADVVPVGAALVASTACR